MIHNADLLKCIHLRFDKLDRKLSEQDIMLQKHLTYHKTVRWMLGTFGTVLSICLAVLTFWKKFL